MFRGFGPAVIGKTGVLAIVTGLAQWLWPPVLANGSLVYFMTWTLLACLCAGLIGAEMFARSRRLHGGLANAMVFSTVESFLPAGAAGAAIAIVLYVYAPSTMWLLPGLWQILVALGLFSAARNLPVSTRMVGTWYFYVVWRR